MTAATKPPHFLCIGAHKAGTTWLYENLRRHPGVWLPPVKEVHFFDGMPGLPRIAQRLNSALRDVLAAGRVAEPEMLEYLRKYVLDAPKDASWYHSLFAPAGDRIAGDITPAYATLAETTVAKIHALLPFCRIIYIMRDPVSRAWSHLRDNAGKYGLEIGNYRLEDFKRHIDSPASMIRTAYTRTIQTWEKYFPAGQILYLFYDDLRDRPIGFLQSVLDFLRLPFDGPRFSDTMSATIHGSIDLQMPDQVRVYLAQKYHGEIIALQRRFGEPVTRWLADCEAVLQGRAPASGTDTTRQEPVDG